MVMTDEEILRVVAEERRRSLGLAGDDDLAADRERALNYYKGEMGDTPALAGRSKAVSTDVADAVETILPDLVEIFTGGDEVASFRPVGPEDEEAARQETDYVNHVVFAQNPGFLIFYTLFKDALLQKTGVAKFWWAEGEGEVERFEGKTAVELEIVAQAGGRIEGLVERPGEDGRPVFDFSFRRASPGGGVRIAAVPPEDFAVAADAPSLEQTHYCAMRTRARVQDLIADGYDPALAEALPACEAEPEPIGWARDTAGEQDIAQDGGADGLKRVEIVEHYLRVDADGDGLPELWRIVTGAQETVLLARERADILPFAAVTPFLTPHRFYGRSVADLLLEVQRIKTALTRMALDAGYFALNQRQEVAMDRANAFTISDLLRNEPGVPVRSRTGDAVRPIAAGGLGFDAFGALEYFSTVAEQRTGIVRNAQGLNPDTLHDTARGAMALMGAAQKRVRLIARIFAETGVKDLFLGVHALSRRHATAPAKARLRGRWVEIDPTAWGARNDMVVEIGLGAGGRDHDLATARELWALQREIVGFQGGLDGPFVTAAHVHNLLRRLCERAGLKSSDPYFADPALRPPPAPPAPDGPSPLLEAVRTDAALKREKMQAELALKREQTAAELALKREQIAAEAALRRMEAELRLGLKTRLPDVTLGGRAG